MKLLVLAMHKEVKEIHWDYFIGSKHKQFLFTSCNASKKRMSKRSKGVRFLLLYRTEWRKIVQAPTMVWCFYFRHVYAELFFTSQYKDWRWKTVKKHHSSNQITNESTSQCKSQYYEINVSTVHVLNTSTKIWCNWALNSSRI